MNRFFTVLSIGLLFISSTYCQADTIRLNGPSFEQEPFIGGKQLDKSIKYWFDCGTINFPNDSPPDIHPVNFWGVPKTAFEGKTYLGLVVRDDDSYESVSQKLSSRLVKGKSYRMSVYLSRSDRYLSPSKLEKNPNNKLNYTNPAVLRVWGGNGYCDDKELLFTTKEIDHSEWIKYDMILKPKTNISSITIEAFYELPVLMPYNGLILVDNLSDIIKLNGEDNKPNTKTDENIPLHLRMKSKNKED